MIISVISGSSQFAPYSKLIRRLGTTDHHIKLLAFERYWSPCPPLKDEFQSLGVLPTRYIGRLWPLLKSLPSIRKAARQSDAVYALGFDMRLVVFLACLGMLKPPIVAYEVHDFRDILIRDNWVGALFRWLDRRFVRHSRLLVVTSSCYIYKYFHQALQLTSFDYFVLENKVDEDRMPQSKKELPSKDPGTPITIGYFGSLRGHDSWETLRYIVAVSKGDISLRVHGTPNKIEGFDESVSSLPGLVYLGPYTSPDELDQLYLNVDLVWIAGGHAKLTGHWTRSCRFYEACFYKRPIISQINTFEGDVVQEYEIGLVVDANDPERVARAIMALTREDIESWSNNMKALPKHLYCYTDEHLRITQILEKPA